MLRKDESVSVPFPSVRALDAVDSLAENFKMRFSDFRSHATIARIFENQFSVEVSDDPQNATQLELTELSYDSVLYSSFNQKAVIMFMILCQCLGSPSYVNWHEIWKVYLVARVHMNRPFVILNKDIEVLFKNHRCALT